MIQAVTKDMSSLSGGRKLSLLPPSCPLSLAFEHVLVWVEHERFKRCLYQYICLVAELQGNFIRSFLSFSGIPNKKKGYKPASIINCILFTQKYVFTY